jgi:hypothetical protein
MEQEEQEKIMSTPVKRGRPKKSDIVSKKKGGRELRGRPAGDTAIINEYKARMLNSPKSAKVLESIFNAALNDDHKNQAAAWKIITDRIVPVSSFEQVKQGGNTPTISINISSFGQPEIKAEEILDKVEVSDVEFKDIDYEDE